MLLRGLSGDSVWRHILANEPEIVTGAAAGTLLKNM